MAEQRPMAHGPQQPGSPEARWHSPDFPQLFCMPKPDADLCMPMDLPLAKKSVENQD